MRPKPSTAGDFLPSIRANGEPPAFATDGRNRIVYWNHAAEQLLGIAPSDAIGRVATSVLTEEELDTSVRLQIPGSSVYLLLPTSRASRRSANTMAKSECPLSSRELQVVELISNGYAAINIAARLNLSQATVRNHIQNILRRLDVHGQVEAVSVALRRGWIGVIESSDAVVVPLFPQRVGATGFRSVANRTAKPSGTASRAMSAAN